MALVVYNTYSKRKEPFRTIEPGKVRMYNCGPTVYARAHVGNFRSYLFADVLRRWLECRGFEVRQVMNVTDVGHLQDDVLEEGEDKVQAAARREDVDPWEICRRYTELFLKDGHELGLRPAHVNPRATEHVPEMLALVEDLIAKGHAYEVPGDGGTEVYFDVTTFPRYGRLSGNRVEELDAGARVAVREEKRHPADFALWKADPRHVMKWESRFGPAGFPGWHVECSAMALKHLGEEIDVHTGGEDNVFPHHECEIAQSECHTGRPFARYWMHARFLQIDGGKMAKSLGNVYSLDDVKARGFEPRALRYALIRGHYREPLNFTWEILESAKHSLETLDDLARRLHLAAAGEGSAADLPTDAGLEAVRASRAKFEGAMDDDLNVPEALASLFELRNAAVHAGLGREAAREGLEFVRFADAALGVIRTERETLDAEVESLIERRRRARAERDFAEADRIRLELDLRGIVLEDTPAGTLWRRS